MHRRMLPYRTTTLSPFDSTCSTWVSTVRMRRVAHASFSTSRFLIQNRLRFLVTPLVGFPPLLPDMHDVDVRNSYSSSNPKSISFVKKTILRFMELCIVKVKTKSDNSFRKKKVWAIKIWKIIENKGEVLVF